MTLPPGGRRRRELGVTVRQCFAPIDKRNDSGAIIRCEPAGSELGGERDSLFMCALHRQFVSLIVPFIARVTSHFSEIYRGCTTSKLCADRE